MNGMNAFLDLVNYGIAGLSSCLSNLGENLKNGFESFFKKHKDSLITFAWLLVVSILIFAYTLVCYSFTVPLSGDGYLQSQTMPFQMYDIWHKFLRNGHFSLWDSSTGLGVNTVGADSFYALFSPFTLITIIFPRSWIPQEIALLYILRITLGGFFFYKYLSSFNMSIGVRRIGGVAFAFCGWVTYYLWFAFYLDAFAFFPLILWGIEKVIQERDPRLLILGFFLTGISNYFFFVVFMIGACLYAMFRYFQNWKQMKNADTRWAVIGMGVSCFVIGILLVAFILLPSIMSVQSMPRVNSSSYLDDLKEAWSAGDMKQFLKVFFEFDYSSSTVTYRKIYPLNALVFMNLASFNNNLMQVSYYDNLSGSSYIFVPLILSCFSGYLYAFKKKRIGTIIGGFFTIFFMAVPFFYYMFSAFTVGYARFYIHPISWMIAFACKTMEERREIPRGYLDASMTILVILQIVAFSLSVWAINHQYEYYSSGYPFESEYWWERLLILPFQFAIDIIDYLIMRRLYHGRGFNMATLILVSVESVAMGNTVILNHGFGNINSLESSNGRGSAIVSNETNLISKLKEYDSSTYRVYNSTVDRNNTNLGLVVGHDSLSSFNSNYAFSAQDFIDWSNMGYSSGNWSMGEHNRRSGIETFLGVKYYMVRHGYSNGVYKDTNIPWGYTNILDIDVDSIDESDRESFKILQQALLDQQSDGVLARDIYVNDNYINLAFAFDKVLPSSTMAEYNYVDANEYAYLRYAIVDSETLNDDENDLYKELVNHNIDISSITSSSKFSASTTLDISLTKTENGYDGTIAIFDNDYPVTFVESDGKYVCQEYNLSFDLSSSTMTFTGFNIRSKSTTFATDGDKLTASISTNMLERQSNLKYTIYASHWDENGKYITGLSTDTAIDHYIYPADTEIDMSNATVDELKGLKYYSKMVMQKKDGSLLAPQASEDNPYYISIVTPDHYEWHIVDEDGNDITYGQQTYSSYQKSHGFYVTKPVKRIIGYLFENKAEDKAVTRPSIYIDSYADYKMAMDKLEKEPIEIEYRRDDRIRFKTNYSSDKYVVLNMPIENGWTLRRWTDGTEGEDGKWEDVSIYKSQGGFVGFLCEEGEALYQLDFETPGLSIGSKATLIGLILTSFMYVAYHGKGLDALMDKERMLREKTYERN